ncbi:MAG: hypothetical protein WAU78_06500 [Roseiarcus sp.]
MAIEDRIDIAQRPMEKRRKVVFLFAGGDRRDDLIEVQVDKKVGRGEGVAGRAAFRAFKQYAVERHGKIAVRSTRAPRMDAMSRPNWTMTIEIGGERMSVLTTGAVPRRISLAPHVSVRRRDARLRCLPVCMPTPSPTSFDAKRSHQP